MNNIVINSQIKKHEVIDIKIQQESYLACSQLAKKWCNKFQLLISSFKICSQLQPQMVSTFAKYSDPLYHICILLYSKQGDECRIFLRWFDADHLHTLSNQKSKSSAKLKTFAEFYLFMWLPHKWSNCHLCVTRCKKAKREWGLLQKLHTRDGVKMKKRYTTQKSRCKDEQ